MAGILHNPITETRAPSRSVSVYVAGSRSRVRDALREHCVAVGLCVAVVDCDYIYTGGAESGVVVRLQNYPRFSASESELMALGVGVGRLLVAALCQSSALVVGPAETVWLSRRAE